MGGGREKTREQCAGWYWEREGGSERGGVRGARGEGGTLPPFGGVVGGWEVKGVSGQGRTGRERWGGAGNRLGVGGRGVDGEEL